MLRKLQFKQLVSTLVLLLCLALFYSSLCYAKPQTVLQIGGSGTDLGTMKLIAKEFMQLHSHIKIIIPPSLGSSGAVRAVKAGKLDIGLLSRALKQQEKNSGVRAVRYARTPLVFAVAADNPISAITTNQLVMFYSGKSNKWQDGSAVRLLLRPKSDSDTVLLRIKIPQLDMHIDAAFDRRGVPVAATDQDMADLLSSVPGALGTSTLALVKAESRPIKPLSINGVMPSAATISNGHYPLVKSLYFAVKSPVSPTVLSFLQFMLSANGKRIFEQTGHQLIIYDLLGM